MNPINIIVESPIDITNIKSHELYHHINDISLDNILEYNVSIVENIKKLSTQTEQINDTIYELVVVYNKNKNKVKRTSKIKITKTTTRIPKRVIERRNIQKFGQAAKSNDGVTMIGDEVFIEPPNSNFGSSILKPISKVKLNIKPEDNMHIKNNSNKNIKFSDRRKLKSYQDNKINEEKINPTKSFNKYLPPGRRNMDTGFSIERSKNYTVFVSGFQGHFTRNNLIDMIPRNIQFIKVSLPIAGNKCKGFGFIDLNSQEDMNNIIKFFDGKLHEHMVLHANEKKNKSR